MIGLDCIHQRSNNIITIYQIILMQLNNLWELTYNLGYTRKLSDYFRSSTNPNRFGHSTYFYIRVNTYVIQVTRYSFVQPKSSVFLIGVKTSKRSSSYQGEEKLMNQKKYLWILWKILGQPLLCWKLYYYYIFCRIPCTP